MFRIHFHSFGSAFYLQHSAIPHITNDRKISQVYLNRWLSY